jgi:hypothetical protein
MADPWEVDPQAPANLAAGVSATDPHPKDHAQIHARISALQDAAYTDEKARDAAAAMIANGTHSGLSVNINDATDSLSFTVIKPAPPDQLSVVTMSPDGSQSTVPLTTAVPGTTVFFNPDTRRFYLDTSATGNLPTQPPIIPPTDPTTPAPTVTMPGQVAAVNLLPWKLTLPVNTSHSGAPDEILQPELSTFIDPLNFFVDTATDDHSNVVVFHARVNGYTTSNTSNPRSELREMSADGTTQASWGINDGKLHTLGPYVIAAQSLPTTAPKRRIVIGQIHDANDDVFEIMADAEFASGSYTITYRLNGSTQNTPLLTNYQLGSYITLKITAQNGTVRLFCNDMATAKVSHTGLTNTGCYFKVGCYTQSNMSVTGVKDTEYGQAALKSLPAPTHV